MNGVAIGSQRVGLIEFLDDFGEVRTVIWPVDCTHHFCSFVAKTLLRFGELEFFRIFRSSESLR